ncbi:MAG: glycosyltransferase, partial [Spirochaetaceae bacterium]|nr:glycosyltransferase [Spirochaetaceae bacterium]
MVAGATIAFTGGGSGGHVYPGLAVIEALRARGFGGRIAWIGSTKASDRAAVEGAGIEY